MSNRRIAGLHSANKGKGPHPRLIAASGGDVEHAERIADELGRVRANREASSTYSAKPGEKPGELELVIRLPRLYPEDWLEPDAELEEVERPGFLESSPRPLVTAAVAAGLGLLGWLILAAIAYGAFRLYGWAAS